MIEAFNTFEKFYLSRKNFPDFMEFSEKNYKKLLQNYSTGCCFSFPERDYDGCRIVVVRICLWQTEDFTPQDAIRLLLYTCMTLLEEEETQVAGISFIVDLSGITTRHIVSPMIIKRILDLLLGCEPMRIKKVFAVNVPAFAKWILDMVLPRVKEKFNFRFHLIDTVDDLKSHIDDKLLPKEFGGLVTCEEMLKLFQKVIDDRKEIVIGYLTIDIDWSKVPDEKLFIDKSDVGTGSFRKLEID